MLDPLINILTSNTSLPSLWGRTIVIVALFAAAWAISRLSAFVARRVLVWHDRRHSESDVQVTAKIANIKRRETLVSVIRTGIAYAAYQVSTRNYRQVIFSATDVRGVWPMVRHYFFFGPRPSLGETYNPLQKLAYTSALGLGVVLVATGLALYKPVQLSWLVWAFGGLRLTRIWHFAAMTGVLGFIPGHLIMVALHGWSNFASMWTGASPGHGHRPARRSSASPNRSSFTPMRSINDR